MQSAIRVLQEMMRKLDHTEEYDLVSQTGPGHELVFEYKCVAEGVTVTGTGRTKKGAKQDCARRMLHQLNARGYPVPPPFGTPRDPSSLTPLNDPAWEVGINVSSTGHILDKSHVSMLKKLCDRYRLGRVEYTVTTEPSPPQVPRFRARVEVGEYTREAVGGSKKEARRLAAEQLYEFLCSPKDVEEEATRPVL